MQNQLERIQQMAGMQRNFLRDFVPADAPESRMTERRQICEVMTERESFQPTTPFPDQTPPGMAYVPYQQWEEPYDADTAFPIGTMFPALDYPYRGGGSFA